MASKLLIVIYLLYSTTSVAENVTGWLFYAAEVRATENDDILLLVISILGTVLCPLDLINLGFELYLNKMEGPASDIMSLFVVLLNDVPQMGLSLLSAMRRVEAASVIQLTATCFTLVKLLARCCLLLVKVRRNKERQHRKWITALFALGVVAKLGLATAIVYFNVTGPGGHLNLKTLDGFTVAPTTTTAAAHVANVSHSVGVR